MEEDLFDEEGNVTGKEKVYVFDQKVVETDGVFLWPRQKRKDGKWFGFNRTELAKKKAQYLDTAQFYAQYYMDASDPLNKRITDFQYYDKGELTLFEGYWYINKNKLNVFAAVDFAATTGKRSDYTAIVVIGVDKDHSIFVLDIDRFKTDKISEIHERLTRLYNKWNWIKLRAETNAQQNLVVEQIKENNRKNGIFYTIDKVISKGDKEIRIMTNLEPRYSQGTIFHYKGGECENLEQELQSTKPPHDDISDAFASAVEIAIAPAKKKFGSTFRESNVIYHPKFGGVY